MLLDGTVSYRTVLLTRWARREWLAVAVVALAVAFLTGTALLLLAAGTQTAGVAAQFNDPGRAMYVENVSRAAQPTRGTTLPVTSVVSNRSTTSGRAVGIPPDVGFAGARLRATQGSGVTRGQLASPRSQLLRGPDGSLAVTVRPRPADGSVFPPRWYVADAGTVRALGATDAFIVTDAPPTRTTRGVPLVGALAFFVLGTREAISALGVAALGAGLLVGVTVFSVARMSVRERRDTIRIARATGAAPQTILVLFTLRAGLVTATGVALGYAGGVITAHGAVSLAIALGIPTTLPVAVSPAAVRLLVPLFLGVVATGLVAGGLAVRPAVRGPVRTVGRLPDRGGRSRLPSPLRPRLLGWRVLVPTTATLTAFVVFAVLIAGLAGAAGPVVATNDAVVTEPRSTHPVSSQLPAAYAEAVREQGIPASGEILLFEAYNGRPYLARGAAFGPFANTSGATLRAGRPHTAPDEAVIGADLATTLDLEVGDRLTVGGSTRPAVTRVRIVGVFDAAGARDDQLLVSLPTARHLAGIGPGQVHFIRAERIPEASTSAGIEVTDLAVDEAIAGETLSVEVAVRNLGLEPATRTVTVRYRGAARTRTVSLPPAGTETLTVTFPAGDAGTSQLQAGNRSTTATVRNATTLLLEGVPPSIPPDSEPRVRVTDATGTPVPDATLTVANRTRRTTADGTARLPPLPEGTYTVEVAADGRTTTATLTVAPTAAYHLDTAVRVTPATPTLLTRPEVTVRLMNPWNRTLRRTVTVATSPRTVTRPVALAPGETRRLNIRLPRQSPGAYEITVTANGTTLATRSYEVTGDERAVAALASSGRTSSSGIGEAIAVAFGNLRVVFAALLALAAAMTVGGTAAVFTQAVHARHRTFGIYRATGAGPTRVLWLIGRDALLLGMMGGALATVIATAGLTGLAALGYLTAFGVRLPTTLGLAGTVGVIAGGVVVTGIGAALAAADVLAAEPSALLGPDRPREPDRSTERREADRDG